MQVRLQGLAWLDLRPSIRRASLGPVEDLRSDPKHGRKEDSENGVFAPRFGKSDAMTITKLKIPVGQQWVQTIANTCNGLLCLVSHSRVMVCNPVTGEFVTLPDWDHNNFKACGLGLDPKTGRYKVVILYSLTKSSAEL